MHRISTRSVLRALGSLSLGALVALTPSSAHADSPGEYLLTIQPGYRFESVNMSGDGTKIMATARNRKVVYSIDGGLSWTTASNSGDSARNTTSSMSRNGNVFYNSDGGWVFYKTEDLSLNSWQHISNENVMGGQWSNSGVSSDGSVVVVTNNTSGYAVSTDAGVNYTNYLAGTEHNWGEIQVSNDGTQVVMMERKQAEILTSTDQGATLVAKFTPDFFRQVAMVGNSSDVLYASDMRGATIYKSTNFGDTWSSVSRDFLGQISSVAVTDDGSHFLVSTVDNGVWASANDGTSWTQVIDALHPWVDVAIDESGNNFTAVASDGAMAANTFAMAQLLTVTECTPFNPYGPGTLLTAFAAAEANPDLNQIQFAGEATECFFNVPTITFTTPINIVGPINALGEKTVRFDKENTSGDMFFSNVETGNTLTVSNIEFASFEGSGNYITSAGNVNVNNVSMNTLTDGSAIASTSTSSIVTVTGSTFTANHSSGNGAAINAAGMLWVNNSQFASNSAENGGAIYTGLGSHIAFATFTENVAKHGGAFYSPTVSDWNWIDDSTFISNRAEGAVNSSGGAYAGSSNAGIAFSTFRNNLAVNGGAVAFTINGYSPSFNSDTFTSNRASGKGGGLYTDATVTINYETRFTRNEATLDGGAIWSSNELNSGTNNTVYFEYNRAGRNGGAIATTGATVNISQSMIFGNNADGGGGGVYIESVNDQQVAANVCTSIDSNTTLGNGGGILTVGNVSLTCTSGYDYMANSADGNGGAVAMVRATDVTPSTPGTFSFFWVSMYNNHADGFGGAIYAEDATGGIGANWMRNNTATSGGAIYMATTDPQSLLAPTFNSSEYFEDNSASQNGGSIYLGSQYVANISGAIYRSTALNGGAIYAEGNELTLDGTTLVAGNVTTGGAGRYVWTESTVNFANNIIVDDSAIRLGSPARFYFNNGSPDLDTTTFTSYVGENAAPPAPILNSLNPLDGQLHIDVSVLDDGIAQFDHLEYRIEGGTWVHPGETGNFTIYGLTNGIQYLVELRSCTTQVCSEPSNSLIGTPAASPSAPVDVWVQAADTHATVSFGYFDNGGLADTNFYYSLYDPEEGWSERVNISAQQAIGNTFQISGLTNNTQYALELGSINAVGESGTTYVDFYTNSFGYTDPELPTNITLLARNYGAGLTFTPSESYGVDIEGYQYRVSERHDWRYLTQDAEGVWLTEELDNNVTYEIQIRAITQYGRSHSLTVGSVTPGSVLESPSVEDYIGLDGGVRIDIEPSDPSVQGITGYQYRISEEDPWVSVPATATEITILNLTNLHSYRVDVRIGNSNGWSESRGITVTPHPPAPHPASPTVLSVVPLDLGFRATIQAADDFGFGTEIDFSSPQFNSGAWYRMNCNAETDDPTLLTCDIGQDWWSQQLTNFETYEINVRQKNEWANGTPTGQVATIVPVPKPDAPSGFSVAPRDKGADITVEVPDNGGPAVTGYQYYIDNIVSWTTVESSNGILPVSHSNMVNGNCYTIHVYPVNASGRSAEGSSTSVCPMATGSAPSAPTDLSATPGNGLGAISFTPGSDNGSAITNYEYRLNSGSWVAFSPATGAVDFVEITGLTNGTTYGVELRAVSDQGTSEASTYLEVTPRTVPSAPNLTSVTAGDETIDVAFTAGSDGGAAITSYEYRLGSSGTWTPFAGTDSPQTISELTNGTSYTVYVRAVNEAGNSNASNSRTATPRTIPDAPMIGQLTGGDESISVDFTLGQTGGSAITSVEYLLDETGDWTAFSGTSSPQVITGLQNGTTYSVQVRAVNVAGSSLASDYMQVIPVTTPEAPTDLDVAVGDGSVTIEFAPGFDGGTSVTTYQWQINGVGAWHDFDPETGAVNVVTITGLTNGTSYTFKLRAVNSVGAGESSVATPSTLVRTTPSAPTGIEVTPANTGLLLNFTPGNNGGSAITNYEYSIDGTDEWTALSPATGNVTELVILGLENGTEYAMKLRAVNIAGSGAESEIFIGTPDNIQTAPHAPIISGIVAGDSSATVSFTLGFNGGSDVTNLKYSIDGGDNWTAFSPPYTTSPVVVIGLTNGQTYDIGIRAVNDIGDGEVSNFVSATPIAPAPSNSVAPILTGTGVIGSTLSATTGTWSGSGTTFVSTWYLCTSAVTSGSTSVPSGCTSLGAAATYKPLAAQYNKYIAVGVVGTRGGSSVTKMSNSVKVTAVAPSVTKVPTIKGTVAKGKTLTLSTGTWAGTGVVLKQQWYACKSAVKVKTTAVPKTCTLIKSATGKTFKVTATQKGKYIAVAVTGTNVVGTKLISMTATTPKKAV